ncbi:MAG: FecCD family ABC transporter permease [Pseudochelatococcus sp.]|jgi:iron complex transport system permease protein|uniref:FecCD family ABC transporter permease n=1 Tax=Pseudochelatococcus sp. TaxID=2020869 RepID=UPI003D8B984C
MSAAAPARADENGARGNGASWSAGLSRALGASLAVAVLVAAIMAGVSIGETSIPLRTILHTLANELFGAGYAVDPIDRGIVWHYRLSRTFVAACCGAGLAASGVVLQALLRNALADPYILGISAGASTGAVAVTIAGLGAGAVSLSLGAFAGAIVAFLFVIVLARAAGGGAGALAAGQIVLAGIAGSQLFNALTSFIITKSANAEQARGIMFWLLGNLSGARWADVGLVVPVALAGVTIVIWHARALDAFVFGADSAASLGVPVRRVQVVLITVAALLTAVMVSVAGSIGFVGLVVPHAVRFLVGVRHGRLIPASAVAGAAFLITADILSRTLIPGQVLPIGVITALVGAPVFGIILIRGRRPR